MKIKDRMYRYVCIRIKNTKYKVLNLTRVKEVLQKKNPKENKKGET